MIQGLGIKLSEVTSSLVKGDGLKARLGRGSVWAIVGFGGNTILRMLSSLILTRIFMPEVFGLMAIITSIMVAIELLSDVGIKTSVMQNPRGEDKSFLKTAWTLQVIRGIFLLLIIFIISDYLADLYNEPELSSIMPTLGIAIVIKSLASTSLLISLRRLDVKRPTILELLAQGVGLITAVILALTLNSIWAFIYGWLASSFVSTLGSYVFLRHGVVGLEWNKAVVNEIIKFGKWIFLATILTFLVGQGDRLILGLVMTKSELGLYNLATMFSQLSMGLLAALVSKTIMPALAEVANSREQDLSSVFNSVRKTVIITILPMIVATSIFGSFIIELFYQEPYYNAGWMLQILSAGMVVHLLVSSISPIFLSKGDSFSHMLSIGTWAIIFISSMLIGYQINKTIGLVIAISIAPLLWLPVTSYLASKHVKINHKMNALIIFGSGGVIAIGWAVVGLNIKT